MNPILKTILIYPLALIIPVVSLTTIPLITTQPQRAIAANLSDSDINNLASEITVKINGPKGGSGVIVEQKDHTYYVLTNWHVVSQPGDYEIQTSDGKIHPVYYHLIKKVPNTDLAILPFSTFSKYRLVAIGQSENLNTNHILYVAGWPWGNNNRRILLSTKGNFSHQQNPTGKDRTIVYTNLVRAGMSGGPILDEEGKLVGVNRSVGLEGNSDQIISEGVPIETFLQWRETVSLPVLPKFTATPADPPKITNQTNTNLAPNNPSIAYNNTNSNYGLSQTLATGLGSVSSVAIATIPSTSSVIVASGSGQGSISVWNLNNNSKQTWKEHTEAVNSIAITPNAQILISGSDDKTIKIWNLISGEVVRTLTEHNDAISSIAISPDGETFASGSWDKTARIWDLKTGELKQTLIGHANLIAALTFTPDGQNLITASKDKTIKIWDAKTGQLKNTLSGHKISVLSIAISPNGQILASGDGDGSIKIWNLTTGELIKTLTGHNDGVWSIAITPDNSTLISGSWDKTIKIWQLDNGALKSTLTGHTDYVNTLAISKDGATLISGSWDGKINLWSRK